MYTDSPVTIKSLALLNIQTDSCQVRHQFIQLLQPSEYDVITRLVPPVHTCLEI